MNELLAKEILGIKEDVFTLDLCKKKYRMLALKYHPDKNSSQDATNKFIHVNEAYEYLSQCKERSEVDYKSLFLSFINKNKYCKYNIYSQSQFNFDVYVMLC